MASCVDEVMNREVFCVERTELAADVGNYLCTMHINAAPVVDEAARPLGFVSMRDLFAAPPEATVEDVMTEPAEVARAEMSVEHAAKMMARSGHHHLPVIDAAGQAVGFLGALDVIRGLVGEPTQHPGTVSRHDARSGLDWTDPLPLTDDNVARTPEGPGVYRLIRSRPGEPDRLVWSEATRNVRARLQGLLDADDPVVLRGLDPDELVVSAAATPRRRG